MPKISVIVPVYNVEKYLNKCIESILNQTFKDFELILVDDGSPDNCGTICDEYALKDNRIKVIHKENGGLSDARNAGINISQGEYIMFVDSDDYITEQMIEILYNAIISDNSDIALCGLDLVDECGNSINDKKNKSCVEYACISQHEALDRLCKDEAGYVVACGKLYKKSIFDDIRFPKGKLNEDAFVTYRIYEKCQKISCVSKLMYKYVQRNGSIMNSVATIRNLDAVEAFVERTYFLLEKNFISIASDSAVRAIDIYRKYYPQLEKNEENKIVISRIEHSLKKMCKELLIKKISIKSKIYFFLSIINMRDGTLIKKIGQIRKKIKKQKAFF